MLYLKHLSGQGKIKLSQGKVREKSGNFENLYEWQPCSIVRPAAGQIADLLTQSTPLRGE